MRTNAILGGLFAAVLFSGCGGGTPCDTTTECNGSEGTRGFVCASGQCDACVTDEDCAGNNRYGDGATCGEDGRCVASCMPGESGCACTAGGACSAGLACQDGTCRGDTGCEGCACGPAGECDTGLACQDGTCVRDCVRGTLDCACSVSGGCDAGLSCSAESGSCIECSDGAIQCPCRSDGTCDAGLACDDSDNVCVPAACGSGSEGMEGCMCRRTAPECDGGVCRSGFCAACSSSIAGCPCEAGRCTGLVCDGAASTCRPALTCADISCAAHQECDLGTAMRDARCGACEPGYQFDTSAMFCVLAPASCDAGVAGSILDACTMRNRLCIEMGANATCGPCVRDYLDEAGVCRPIQTCAGRGCAAMNRECAPPTETSDATCTGCLSGFIESGGACVVDPDVTCAAIGATCTAEHRQCDDSGGPARCGACLTGFVLDPATATCIDPRLCSELDCAAEHRNCAGEPIAACTTCASGYVEDVGTGLCRRPLSCAMWTCPAGYECQQSDPSRDPVCEELGPCGPLATRDAYSGTCVSCPRSCTDGTPAEGETGRIAAGTVFVGSGVPGVCICETEPGYFYSLTAGAGTFACDVDGDGWVRQTARASVEAMDPVLRANARCTLHEIRGVILENEGGARHTETFAPITLFESLRNDDEFELMSASASEVPVYGTRRPRPEELNGMTKLCSGPTADHNHNFVADVAEYAGIAFPTGSGTGAVPIALAPLYTVYTRFSYFAELHQGAFVPDDPMAYDLPLSSGPREVAGLYSITERSRTVPGDAGGVPLEYGRDAGDPGQSYYGECLRHRDLDFATRSDATGLDLAVYPSAASEALMTHHSQYRCVQVVDDTIYAVRSPDRDRHLVRARDLLAPSAWTVNVCSITGDPAVVSATPNPDEARLLCAAAEDPPPLSINQVVWGAVNYLHGTTPMAGSPLAASFDCTGTACPTGMECAGGVCRGVTSIPCTTLADCPPGAGWACTGGFCRTTSYVRGCIDECVEQSLLPASARCPGLGTAGMACEADSANFGRVQCECARNYGDCDGNTSNGCESNLSTDVSFCGDCMTNCATSPHPNAAGETCSAGACQVTSCMNGYSDQNGTFADGCECVADNHANSCIGATDLGSVALGATASSTGNLVAPGDSDWFTVTFLVAADCAWRPRITLGAGGLPIAMRIYTACGAEGAPSGGQTCSAEGATSSSELDLTSWDYNHSSMCGDKLMVDNVPNQGPFVTLPLTVWIRVYATGTSTTCLPYTLTAGV